VVELSGLAALVRATHPLPAAAVTTLVGAASAAREASLGTLAWVVASTALGQASVGWSNDYLDRGRDAAAGRTEKPLVAGATSPSAVLFGALVALPLSVTFSLPVGVPETGVMFAAVLSAWGYNLGLKATVLSWLPYAVSFGLAPVYVWLATSSTDLPPGWIVAATALLGVAGHLLNVLPDLEADRVGAVRGLPHRLGLRGSLLLACSILGGVLALVLSAAGQLDTATAAASGLAAALIVAVAWAGLRGRGRLGFRLTIAAIGAIVLVLLLSPSALRS
jgi:4-hydroxybenzoate polyprenyltransferase